MEGRYNMDIECPRQFAASTRLSFTIRQESIEEVMEAMSLIAPIRYEIKKNKVYITPRKPLFTFKNRLLMGIDK